MSFEIGFAVHQDDCSIIPNIELNKVKLPTDIGIIILTRLSRELYCVSKAANNLARQKIGADPTIEWTDQKFDRACKFAADNSHLNLLDALMKSAELSCFSPYSIQPSQFKAMDSRFCASALERVILEKNKNRWATRRQHHIFHCLLYICWSRKAIDCAKTSNYLERYLAIADSVLRLYPGTYLCSIIVSMMMVYDTDIADLAPRSNQWVDAWMQEQDQTLQCTTIAFYAKLRYTPGSSVQTETRDLRLVEILEKYKAAERNDIRLSMAAVAIRIIKSASLYKFLLRHPHYFPDEFGPFVPQNQLHHLLLNSASIEHIQALKEFHGNVLDTSDIDKVRALLLESIKRRRFRPMPPGRIDLYYNLAGIGICRADCPKIE
jgi:hypothetical protein